MQIRHIKGLHKRRPKINIEYVYGKPKTLQGIINDERRDRELRTKKVR